MEHHSEQIPQVLLFVLGLVPVDHEPDFLRGLTQHVDGFIVTGFAEVDAIYLWWGKSKRLLQQYEVAVNTGVRNVANKAKCDVPMSENLTWYL